MVEDQQTQCLVRSGWSIQQSLSPGSPSGITALFKSSSAAGLLYSPVYGMVITELVEAWA